jgi:hypothetical protein
MPRQLDGLAKEICANWRVSGVHVPISTTARQERRPSWKYPH